MTNQHDERILKNEEQIEKLKATIPDWIWFFSPYDSGVLCGRDYPPDGAMHTALL